MFFISIQIRQCMIQKLKEYLETVPGNKHGKPKISTILTIVYPTTAKLRSLYCLVKRTACLASDISKFLTMISKRDFNIVRKLLILYIINNIFLSYYSICTRPILFGNIIILRRFEVKWICFLHFCAPIWYVLEDLVHTILRICIWFHPLSQKICVLLES